MSQYTHRRSDEDYGDPIMTKAIKAGRRTYFIDVRETKDNDQFLTITESRKRTLADGTATFDRHKIFLYKEDFDKITVALAEVIDFVKKNKPEYFENTSN
ncbi:MAG: DUF3276 family protein [Rikenellaceae bacterium]